MLFYANLCQFLTEISSYKTIFKYIIKDINVNDNYDIPYRLNVFKKVLLKNVADYLVVWSRIKKAKNYKELPIEELGDLVEKARKALDRKYLPHYDPDNFNDIFYRLDYFKKVIDKERLYNNRINF